MNDPARPQDDPVQRYYSPPPPSGFRERLRARRGTLIGAAVVIAVVTALFARAALDDGKGSGDVARAFGGVSEADQSVMVEVNRVHMTYLSDFVVMIGAASNQKLRRMNARAKLMSRSLSELGPTVDRIENTELRLLVQELTDARERVARNFHSLGEYVLNTPRRELSPRRADALGVRADNSVMAMARVETRVARRIKPYMNDEQREAFAQQERDLADRIEEAAAAE